MNRYVKWGLITALVVGVIIFAFYFTKNKTPENTTTMPQQTENTQPLTTDVDREKIEQLENAMDEAQKKINEMNEMLEQLDADAKSKQEILEQLIKARDEFKKQVEEKNINE